MNAAVVALAAAALWSPGFGLDAQGVPIIRIGLATGLDEAEITLPDRTCVATASGGPAKLRSLIGVEKSPPDEAHVEAALAGWRVRGHADARPVERGAVYSFGKGVVDTRVVWIGISEGEGPSLRLVEAPPAGVVSLTCAAQPAQAFRLSGASFRGVAYPGALVVALDAAGKLVMNEVDAETALEAVVPAETFPSAPAAALQAQAVAARNQLLARLGNRHTADPFHLCAQTHCQVYSPSKRAASTSAAVAATRGQVVSRGGALVDAVYSASCGGFPASPTEVFSSAPGVAGGAGPDLTAPPRPWCGQTRFGKDRYRWHQAIPAVRVLERGPSGRVVAAALSDGRIVRGQLPIRRALGDLPSALFLVRDGHAHGGGYGHGAGMCQVGAIAQAEAGRDHGAILRSYYGDDSEIRQLW